MTKESITERFGLNYLTQSNKPTRSAESPEAIAERLLPCKYDPQDDNTPRPAIAYNCQHDYADDPAAHRPAFAAALRAREFETMTFCIEQWNEQEAKLRAKDERIDQLRQVLAAEREHSAELEQAALAAIKYDAAIHARGLMDDVTIREDGIAVAQGEDLDELYDDWIGKARRALAQKGGGK